MIENGSIVERKEQNLVQTIKETLYIRFNNPSLSKNIGEYHLPHIWDEVLFITFELIIKSTLMWLFLLPPVAITTSSCSIHKVITSAIDFPSATKHNTQSGNNIHHKPKA